jgi:uncharacterized membrane protein YphA (DoxX/SURF4 family)
MNTTDIKQININVARWFIRFGLAFVYGYAAVEIYLHPANFMKYIPPTVQSMVPTDLFLLVFGIFEILLVLWLLSGKKTEYAGFISFLLMVGIIIPNTEYFNVLFRNVSIALSSIALTALDYGKYK